MLVGFSFFFVFFFLFLFLPQIGLSVSTAPFFPFLLSFFFLFFFLPQSWCLAFLNSLYLLILLKPKPKPKPICLKLLSQINGSLSLAYFFFCEFLCIWCCRLAVVRWRAWVCGDRHGGGCGFVVIGVCGGVLVMTQIRVWVGRWWVAWLFDGWIGNGWWLDWSLVVGFNDWIEVWWWVSVAEIGVWWWVSVMAQIGVWW